MLRLQPWARVIHAVDAAAFQPDTSRGLRAMVAFMVPVVLAARGWLSLDVSFVALTAQNLALLDVRGDYRLRCALVIAMAAVFVGAASLGATMSAHTHSAVLGMGLMAVLGGLWRHLSSDYGASLAISSTLVFLIAAADPMAANRVGEHALAALLGGVWGVLLQVANWPWRAQHPLRRTVADSWVAISDLFIAMSPAPAGESNARQERVTAAEAALRTALDKTYGALEASRAGPVRFRLEALHLAGARLATRVVGLNTALETAMAAADFAALAPALEPALVSLANLGRGVAVTVVSRQPAHLAIFEVRLRRLGSLLRVLRSRLVDEARHDSAHAQLVEIARQIEQLLPAIHDALRATIERAEERSGSSLELPDLRELALRPLASALNLSTHVEPTLVRYTLRLAALTMFGVVLFKWFGLPHGYWLPFTVVVVLQPDYGSTRQRAGQRVLGTLGGSVLASLLLWLHPPSGVLMAAAALTIFAFGFLVKRNYAWAIFFVTLFLVLLTEAAGPVTLAFTFERLGVTLAGGALALLAAQVFWPVWERDRFPPILAAAFHANRDYLLLLLDRLTQGTGFDPQAVAAKRRAEAANTAAFSSLQRMHGDPKNQRDKLEYAAALANGNQRITRALGLVAIHLVAGPAAQRPEFARFATHAAAAFDAVAQAAEGHPPPAQQLETLRRELASIRFDSAEPDAPDRWAVPQLARIGTELSALLVTVGDVGAGEEKAQS